MRMASRLGWKRALLLACMSASCLPMSQACAASAAQGASKAAQNFAKKADTGRIEQVIDLMDRTTQIDVVSLSPDAKHIAWISRTVASGAKATIADADGRAAIALTGSDDCKPTGVAWHMAARRLAIVSICAPSNTDDIIRSTISFIDPRTGQRDRPDIVLSGSAGSLLWAPDGKTVRALFVPEARRPPNAAAAGRSVGSLASARREIQSVIAIDVDNGRWRTVSDPDLYIYEYTQAPDGKSIAYTAAAAPGDANWWIAKLYAQPADGGKGPEVLFDPKTATGVKQGLQIAQPRWSPDGRHVGFIYGLMSDHGYSGGEIVTADVGSRNLRVWNKGAAVSTAWINWGSQGAIIAGDIAGGSIELAAYRANGSQGDVKRTVLNRPDGMMSADGGWIGASLAADGAFAYIGSSFSKPPELYVGHVARRFTGRPVTQINTGIRPLWGDADQRHWSSDGNQIQGWLLRPQDFDPTRRYPMIVLAHGGPSGVSLPRWPDGRYDGTALAAFGYMIFYPNPRGSFGGGAAFAEASRRDFGGGDFRDIMAGVDQILANDPVDGERLGLTGWSYGGFMTMLGVTRSNRFKAAVAGAGISNWQSLYGQGLINEIFVPFFGATLYDDPEIYAASSPVFGLKNARTPTLSLVGERDSETPSAQSLEFWNGLRSLGVPSDLIIYENEGHQFSSLENRRDLLRRSVNWFDTYLKPEATQP